MPRKRKDSKIDSRTKSNKKNSLSDFEKIQFMQFEYDWQKKRLDDLYNKSNLLLCWNAAIFAFAFAITDVDKIINVIKNYSICPLTSAVVVFVVFVFISMVLIGISTLGFFNCAYMKELMCFKMQDNIEHGFDMNEITDDYKTIIVSYDDIIADLTKKVRNNILIMLIGVTALLIFEFLLRILVSLV